MKLKHFLVIFLLFLFLAITTLSYSNEVFAGLQNNIFRLHILANSDTDNDQNLKLLVRDSILNYMEEINKNSKSKEETIKIISDNLTNLQKIAEKTIQDNGYEYTVSLEIGNFYFPTKHYANISLPAGNYDALKINIGEAKGQNWWCSLFPPLCFIDISSGYMNENDSEILAENLSNEEFLLISSSSPDIVLKFKILELIGQRGRSLCP